LDPKIEISPSGKYRLETNSLESRRGFIKHSVGKVVDNQEKHFERVISVVHRNYEAFPFGWYEGHKDGHDYLVCGFDYQGLTVVRLDTRERIDWVPKEAANGAGFCHTDFYEYRPEDNTLRVEGCVWAGPYKYITYDFSKPMLLPWPEIHSEMVESEDE
jgi:hypothetical protein